MEISLSQSSHDFKESAIETDQTVSFSTPCPVCGEFVLNIVESSSRIHYAAYRCRGCDSFRGWAEKPSTIKRREQIRGVIATLLDCPHLNEWERGFLDSLKSCNKFSPRQIQVLTRIATQRGIA